MNYKKLSKITDMSNKVFEEIPNLIQQLYSSNLPTEVSNKIEFLLSYAKDNRPEKLGKLSFSDTLSREEVADVIENTFSEAKVVVGKNARKVEIYYPSNDATNAPTYIVNGIRAIMDAYPLIKIIYSRELMIDDIPTWLLTLDLAAY